VRNFVTYQDCPILRQRGDADRQFWRASRRSGVPRPHRRFLADHLVAEPSPKFVNHVAVTEREMHSYAITVGRDYPLPIRTVDPLLKHASNLTSEIPVPAEPLVGGFHEHILVDHSSTGESRQSCASTVSTQECLP
jgi:hypothetical protein